MLQNSGKQILHSLPKNESKHFLKSVVYCIIPLSSAPMMSFLSYVAACDFIDFGIFEFCSSWTSQFLPIHEKDEKLFVF